jgi:dipeptidyl aminopeptidase/acylaminoacyl peptidase
MRRRDMLKLATAGTAAALATSEPKALATEVNTSNLHDVEFHGGLTNGYHYPDYLHVPRGRERAPAILLLHGSEGGYAGWNAWLALGLCMHGFVTYPFAYSKGGNAWHAGDVRDVDLERTVDALRWLRRHEASSGKVGLYGVSRGAEHAILLASLMARDNIPGVPEAVAAHAPSDTIAGAFIAGMYNPKERETWDPSKRAWRWRGVSDDLLPTTPIEIERYDGPIFLSHGEADQVWTVECTRRLETRLRNAGRAPEVHYYPDEGHGFHAAALNIERERLVTFFRKHLEAS